MEGKLPNVIWLVRTCTVTLRRLTVADKNREKSVILYVEYVKHNALNYVIYDSYSTIDTLNNGIEH